MPAPTPVSVRRETIVLPTYEPQPPDPNPMFLEQRVYQGASGRVYPLPVTDRIAESPTPWAWDAVWIENEFLRVLILPQLGGRIHRALDKTNGYDFIYYQPVIKPALVGLAGPWASGGIEFNWPQHHRPSTFQPANVAIEHDADGSATVWLGEHEPMTRLKGMHGVRLHPGRSCIEVVGRVHNRTADPQTFLWWANAALRVHGHYQTFFPPDVTCVADHARRAISRFPASRGRYYGVDYAARARAGVPAAETPPRYAPPPGCPPDDLSWYANIPVPTSYMVMESAGNFAGGYDHRAGAGIVHVANHHVAPGKKQWTWGNHAFGYAWDRNLTDPDEHGESAPYIELMTGVYTDNQPDFSFLQPGETKTWSQFWYPIRAIGPAQQANPDAAVSLQVGAGIARIGVATTGVFADATVRLRRNGRTVASWTRSLAPDQPFVEEIRIARRTASAPGFTLSVHAHDGRELVTCTPPRARADRTPPAPATEPAAPAAIASADELYLTGLHLEQYRHATRSPEPYWREGLRRDPGDSRCHLALGRRHLRRGELDQAEAHFRASIARLTGRNANPADGEAFYQLGLCLRHRALAAGGDPAGLDEAYARFYKATWNHAWQAAGYHALAEIDALRHDWPAALDHLDRALRVNTDHLGARNLKAIVLRRLDRPAEADTLIAATLALDPLDWWARHLRGDALVCDRQVKFDLVLDHARAGLFAEALALLDAAPAAPPPDLPDAALGAGPLVHYYRAWLCHHLGDRRAMHRHLRAAAQAAPAYCFPARLDEIAILRHAIAANPRDARAPFYLGHLLYDRRRHREAIRLWQQAVKLEPGNAVAWRNLGLAAWNILHRPALARAAYARAVRAAPHDARLLYERDQLWKRLGQAAVKRLQELEKHPALVARRDDLTIECCALLNQTGRHPEARALLAGRRFQPWEGGEGLVLGQHVRTHLLLGAAALAAGNLAPAVEFFSAALSAPENLSEAKHLLANQSDIRFWIGCAHDAAGNRAAARTEWKMAAEFRGDFQAMAVQSYSEMTFYSALALKKLGRKADARRLLAGLLRHARALARSPATIDYFATSLPTLLLFDDDLAARQRTTALFLEAQARLGLGQTGPARRLLRQVLRRDPNHARASDLLTGIGR